MKKSILTFTLLVFTSCAVNAQWEILNEGFRGQLTSIDFVNDNTGFVGSFETLYKTTDGGENWDPLPFNKNWYISMIDFINDSVGWAVGTTYDSSGSYAIILKTSNGDYNWSIQKQIFNIWLGSIYAIDENNLYAAGNNKIYKTSDGGSHWVDVSPNILDVYYNSLWFQHPDSGVVVGGYFDGIVNRGIILKTTNGGITWKQSIANEFYYINDLQFLDNKTAYFRAHSDTVNFFCKTEDQFETWSIKSQSSYWINSYRCLDGSTVYAAVSDGITQNNIKKSIDDGVTWQDVQSFQFPVDKIYFNESGEGLLLGGFWGSSIICKSTTKWMDWEILKLTYPFQDIYFIDKDVGFLVGGIQGLHFESAADIFFTSDGGKTWEFRYSAGGGSFSGSGIFKTSVFVNNLTGFCLTGSGFGWGLGFSKIYKTTDSGNSWSQIYDFNPDLNGYSFSGNDFYFRNEQIGWVVGRYSDNSSGAGIFHTNDGGKNWSLAWQNLGSDNFCLNSICFNNKSGWAVGESGMIVKYSQVYGWSAIPSLTDLPLKKVFSNDDNVWIAGGYLDNQNSNTIFLKSTNNGQTWIQHHTSPYLINDMYFIDNNLGWAVGADTAYRGVILKSTDGGDTWKLVVDSLLGPLNSIFIKDNYGWAAGDYGLVLRTTDAGTTWIDDGNNKTYPTEFELKQNYPNPFNPNTTLSFVIGHLSFVTLKIYDILGKEIATVVSEEKSAGKYEIEFDGSNLSSGIYFYELKTRSYTVTKKMVLLK
ncbi:MAG: hypothetical protein A2000_10600 [Ignavibacteria bacterium GWB2_36_8]|nr:MAG: hypothetical protein A2000_10600 [Ignavibacteria bacterium GWB2_36_8]